ncbi:MOSC domain-containing protein [Kitasatospora nipponensis]|uniref:MOSC domain-containing protein n=1 Tax=Kitasatospora nipponensis TaxID=258049 RepID=A0ABN1WGL4_9ACTN
MRIGTVRELWRYPVKSMLGEALREAEVDERGVRGDRALALVDRESGRVASAKNPRLWRALLTLSASRGADGRVRIVRADGGELKAEELSAVLGRPVELTGEPPQDATLDRARPEEVLSAGVRARVTVDVSRVGSASPPGTFFDYAPLHLLSTASLARIGALSPRGSVEAVRYRPNLVIEPDPGAPGEGQDPGFVEDGWLGRELAIGARLRVRAVVATPRCAVPTLAHGRLPRDPQALRVPARHHRVEPLPGMGPHPCVGVYAQVLESGPVAEGDEVRLL